MCNFKNLESHSRRNVEFSAILEVSVFQKTHLDDPNLHLISPPNHQRLLIFPRQTTRKQISSGCLDGTFDMCKLLTRLRIVHANPGI